VLLLRDREMFDAVNAPQERGTAAARGDTGGGRPLPHYARSIDDSRLLPAPPAAAEYFVVAGSSFWAGTFGTVACSSVDAFPDELTRPAGEPVFGGQSETLL